MMPPAAHAQNTNADTSVTGSTIIDIAGNKVPVLTGGLYDRYRSNPPLSVISSEAPELDLSWFNTLRKEKVNIGFESYSPNFYYKNSRVSLIYTADIEQLRALIPPQISKVVQPLQIWPGRGVIAVTAYAYHHCDNDVYNEVAVSVVTNKPGSSNWGPLSMFSQNRAKDYWGYVLKLPVNTELAKVRGVVGYNLPKWKTDISYKENGNAVSVVIKDDKSGRVDLTLETQKLPELSNEPELVTNGFTNVDHNGRLTTGYAVSRQLSHASSSNADTVKLSLGEGPLSSLLKSLDLGKLLKYEYVPEFQSALYAPKAFQDKR